MIPRRRSTAVHFQSVERRAQRNLEGLANVRLDPDELPGCRAAALTFFSVFFFKCLHGGEDSERGETKFSAGVTVTAPTTIHAEERQHECSQRRSEVRAGRLSSRFRLRAYRPYRLDQARVEACTTGFSQTSTFTHTSFSGRTNGAQWRQGESKFLPCFS